MSPVTQETIQATLASKVAVPAQYVGSAISVGSATYLGLTLDQWSLVGIFFGMVVGFAGFVASLYFKHQHLKLARKTRKADPDE